MLFELRCVHPFLHAGAGLLACAATVTCFALGALSGTSLRAHEAGGSAADLWAAAKLRIASLLVNSLTAALVLLLLRSHLASCVVKPQLGGSAAVSVAATVAALGYIAVFVSRAVGSSAQADMADITATIGMAAYTLMVRPCWCACDAHAMRMRRDVLCLMHVTVSIPPSCRADAGMAPLLCGRLQQRGRNGRERRR